MCRRWEAEHGAVALEREVVRDGQPVRDALHIGDEPDRSAEQRDGALCSAAVAISAPSASYSRYVDRSRLAPKTFWISPILLPSAAVGADPSHAAGTRVARIVRGGAFSCAGWSRYTRWHAAVL